MNNLRTYMKKNSVFYLLIILICLVMRFFTRTSDSNLLLWILAPTSRWAGILGGIPFEYVSHTGYVNHYYRFILAPSCSGIRFMTIVFLMAAFSFLHRIPSAPLKCLWLSGSVVFSYLSTIFVNGIRIVAAIYLPIPLEKAGLLSGWLNPDRLHTLIGTVIYFSSLCAIYPIVCHLYRHFEELASVFHPCQTSSSYASMQKHKLFIPIFWYLPAVLILPALGRLFRNDWEGFTSYALLIAGSCLIILTLITLIRRLFTLCTRD